MMHITHRQEHFSRSFISAVVHSAGFKVQRAEEPDDQERPVSVIGELVRELGGFILKRPRDFQVRDDDGL